MPIDPDKAVNRDNWDSRVPIHYESEEYGIRSFIEDPDHISGVVRFDRSKMPSVDGSTLLHLQCHIGTDTVSWARLGAEVTGVDFSEQAIAAARRLSQDSGTPARFVVSELYEAPSAVVGPFDVVYTGVGAINWLPDIEEWAKVVSSFLKSGGRFYMREGHPMMWTLDWDDPGRLTVDLPYFEGRKVEFAEENTYAGRGVLASPRTVEWNHGIAETLQALIDSGLRIDHLEEYDFCEWQGHPQMVLDPDGLWRLPDGRDRLPLMWSVLATKN